MISRPKPSGWKRHLDGWQAGVIVVAIAGSAILLAVPRAVAPEHAPAPQIDWPELAAVESEDDRLAVRAQTETLDVDVRAVGSEFRTYNRAVKTRDEAAFAASRYAVVDATRKALRLGVEQLRALRAYQTARFVGELRRWEETGEESEELVELSGDFVDTLKRNAWCEPEHDRKLVMSDHVLRTLFKKRWNDIAGVRGDGFDLTLDEDRVRHGFLIRYPFRSHFDVRQARIDDSANEKRRLSSVDRLGERDPSYPVLVARGVVHYQSGSYARAAAAFRAYLDGSPDGPYTLRVRNYLKASLDRTAETGGI